jgi:hypothetical protein
MARSTNHEDPQDATFSSLLLLSPNSVQLFSLVSSSLNARDQVAHPHKTKGIKAWTEFQNEKEFLRKKAT